MVEILDLLAMSEKEPSGYTITRGGVDIVLTNEEVLDTVFFHYDRLGQNVLEEACLFSEKQFTEEQKEKLLEEITLQLSEIVYEKIDQIANKLL